MKFLQKTCILGLILVASVFTVHTVSSSSAYAADLGSCRYFLGMQSWDCNIEPEPSSTSELQSNIWIIAANVFVDITVIAAYLVLGYVIYGGYLYIFASGDPGKVMSGKKTLTHAFIGLAIVLLANIILHGIEVALLGDSLTLAGCANNLQVNSDGSVTGSGCVDDVALFNNAVNWVIGIAGAVALIFVLIGGVSYVTSAGDPSKLQRAKQTILYALIGLAIVGLAEVITIFVSSLINDAADSAFIPTNTLIAKE